MKKCLSVKCVHAELNFCEIKNYKSEKMVNLINMYYQMSFDSFFLQNKTINIKFQFTFQD